MLKKKICTIVMVSFFVGLCIYDDSSSAAQKKTHWLNSAVSVRFQNERLENVLGKISKQTGVVIVFNQELADEKVTGNYKGIKLSDAINRLFLGKNKTVQTDRSKKIILVKTFRKKDRNDRRDFSN
ncbi:MAG: hypothetical protein D3924_14565 [Candidatus Electrothrix sp. AR4]|nr:hypothetical protein [Candidatus Electrothrix sp. AR4]